MLSAGAEWRRNGNSALLGLVFTSAGVALAGFARDRQIATVFGASVMADAISISTLYVDGLAVLVLSGPATLVLTPRIIGLENRGHTEEADGLLTVALLTTAALSVAVLIFLLAVHDPAGLLAMGASPEVTDTWRYLLIPTGIAAGLQAGSGWFAGYCQARGRVLSPVVARAGPGLGCAVALLWLPGWGVSGFAVGLVVGSVLQHVYLGWRCWSLGWTPRLMRVSMTDAHELASAALPVLVAVLLTAVVMPIAQRISVAELAVGDLASYSYATRLIAALSIVSMSISTLATNETASVQHAPLDTKRAVLVEQFERMILLLLPLCAVLGLLAEPVTGLLFGQGAFDNVAVTRTGAAVRWLSFGAVFGAVYSLQQRQCAALGSPMGVLLSVVLWVGSTLLVTWGASRLGSSQSMAIGSVAGYLVATLAGAMVLVAIVGASLLRQLAAVLWRPVAATLLGLGLASAVLALAPVMALATIVKIGLVSTVFALAYLSAAGLRLRHLRQVRTPVADRIVEESPS